MLRIITFTIHNTLCVSQFSCTLGARGFRREEPRSAISEVRWGEERENRQEVRIKTHTNRFELGSRSDPASWLEEPYRCVVIGCLLIDLVMLIDSHHSIIIRFALPATRGFLSPLLSLSSCLFAAKENLWDQGSSLVACSLNHSLHNYTTSCLQYIMVKTLLSRRSCMF